MKIYISGPITGIENDNKAAFYAIAMALKTRGHDPVNPHEVCKHLVGATWKDYMREDLKSLLDCEAVYVLPGYLESKGAGVELQLAINMRMPIYESLDSVPA